MSLRLLTTADAEAWEAALPTDRSAFGSLGFARVQERAGAGESRLLVSELEAGRLAYPLTLRRLAGGLPFSASVGEAIWDSSSPPFTGPIVAGELAAGELDTLREGLAARMRGEGIVAEFAHVHPWAAKPALLGGGDRDREIVWVDLALAEEALWRESYSKACRKNVNRAEREGVTVRAASGDADVGEFHRIYTETMERNRAADAYFFDRAYFQAIFDEMPGAARFALAEHDGRVIAATLYLHDADDVYSYLGGADHDHQQLRPTNAVVHETIRWARTQGKRRLILGGGYRPDDGIFRFKASFSPLRAPLELVRRVHLQEDYDHLVAAWRAFHGRDPDTAGYFPLYRAAAE